MGTIVYQTKNGVKYAYESVSYWDKDKKAPRSKRKYLGKVDPETGEIVKARGKAGENTDSRDDVISHLKEQISEKDTQIVQLKEELQKKTEQYRKALNAMDAITDNYSATQGYTPR